MYQAPFYFAEGRSGKRAVCATTRQRLPMVTYSESPNASAHTNYWLACKMLRLYSSYYHKVMRESRGEFWGEMTQTSEKK